MHQTQKFYKVFVSSTYEDLKAERNQVFDSLLKVNCFPVGMEHFPGSDARSLDLIKKYIDQCDYFLIVSAGMYGSLVPETKVSYTEWEYDYATARAIPCYAFVHRNVNELLGEKIDSKNRKQLDAFHQRLLAAGREVKQYGNKEDLGAKVLHAFQNAPLDTPAMGWVKARREPIPQGNELVGGWKLVKSNKNDWNQADVIKFYTDKEVAWIRFDRTLKRIVQFISGTYLTDSYQLYVFEVPLITSPRMPIVGKEQEFQIVELSNETLKTSGTLSTGALVDEEYRRIDWETIDSIFGP